MSSPLSSTLFETTAPSKKRWTELALALGGFAIGTGEFSIMGLLPNVATELDVSIPQAGQLVSAYALGVTIGAPVLAVAFARLPRKAMLLWMMGAFALGNVASAWAPTFQMLRAMRFITGLPHGAFFGVAALLVAELAGPGKRASAVGRLMLGLTIATIIGTPLATTLGQHASWRSAYLVIAALAFGSWVLTLMHAPKTPIQGTPSPLRELGALAKPQVWLTLGIGSVGFGGLFAIYTYLNSTMTQLAGLDEHKVPLVLSATGVGMLMGNLVGSKLADRSITRTIAGSLVWNIATASLFALVASSALASTVAVVMLGWGFALVPALQTRLMDVAGDAQTLAASLNHSAFNIANALGALFGGMAISAGFGWQSTGWVGAAMAGAGLVLFLLSLSPSREGVSGDGGPR